MSNEKNVADKTSAVDPSLLGVSVPLSITKAKTFELIAVWRECALALFAAAKGRVAPAVRSEANGQVAVSQQTPVARA